MFLPTLGLLMTLEAAMVAVSLIVIWAPLLALIYAALLVGTVGFLVPDLSTTITFLGKTPTSLRVVS